MVKIIYKSKISHHIRTKRVRGLKFKIIQNKRRKNSRRRPRRIVQKYFDKNYYLKPKINFFLAQEEETLERLRNLENTEFFEQTNPTSDKYIKKDRELAIIGLKDIVCQIIAANKKVKKIIPDNFIPSVIALLDYYLKKTEKQLNRANLIKALFSALIFLDEEKGLGIFNKSFLNNFELTPELLVVVDINLYPVKVYDYFQIFFLRISQVNKYDLKHKEYLRKFKKVFKEFDFYLSFNNNYKIFKPYQNFICCLLLTKNFLKNNSLLKDEIVDNYIEYFKSKVEYDEYLYNACCYNIKESKYIFDNYMNVLNVNNLCNQGLINMNNINFI
jgi:hypothetical protein